MGRKIAVGDIGVAHLEHHDLDLQSLPGSTYQSDVNIRSDRLFE